ncbi:MAG: helix-turn-helix transcriptional regulator [Clostridia bacterium]|nr:helix-turn-helix transcriptional regulator [Clostridia bacterium]
MATNSFDRAKIGKRIKHHFKTSKFKSQAELASACDTNVRTVSRWFDEGVDNINVLNRIATVLEVDVMAILF